MRQQDLIPVSADMFFVGMQIDSPLYFEFKNNYILLCRDVRLSRALVEKIRQTAVAGYQVFADRSAMDELVRQSGHFRSLRPPSQPERPRDDPGEPQTPHLDNLQAKISLQESYLELIDQFARIVEIIERTRTVPNRLAGKLIQTIGDQLELRDPSFLIQCVSHLRKMERYLDFHSVNVAIPQRADGPMDGTFRRGGRGPDQDRPAPRHRKAPGAQADS